MDLRDVPVIVVSAMDDLENIARCIQLGTEDHLTKPFDPTILKARLEATLSRKRLRDQEAAMAENLRQEKSRADGFLNAMLPPGAVSELKASGRVAPRRHDDVVGFTAHCDATPPEQVVDELQALVAGFEALTERHGLEKIKTIGDAYMATAGLMRYTDTPLVAAIRCGLDMAERAATEKPNWQVRIGVHSGPVVAGFVGDRQYMFDVWGDTVNMAARLSAIASPGTVAVTADCWQWVRGEFGGRSLGTHDVKGKGPVELVECRPA